MIPAIIFALYISIGLLGGIGQLISMVESKSKSQKELVLALLMPFFWLPLIIVEFVITTAHFIYINRKRIRRK